MTPTIRPFGDSALLITFGEVIDPQLNARVHALARALSSAGTPWRVPVPAYSSLLAPYDIEEATYPQAITAMQEVIAGLAAEPELGEGEIVEIAVRYGGEEGSDLTDVAARCGLEPEEVVRLHSGVIYRVFMLGFAPGFAYLGPLPAPLVLPRRATPRPRVPAGSVAIAGLQTGIYPLATPGGWHLLGRTDAPLWNPTAAPPALLYPGARVRFVAL